MTPQNPPLPPSDAPVDWDKLGRYVADELPPGEAQELRRWLEQHPAEAALVAAAKHVTADPGVDVEAALLRVKTRMHSDAPLSRREFASPASWRRYAVLAAAAAIILTVGVTLRQRAPRGAAQVTNVAASSEHATAIGERKTIRLADGTEVILGPASRLLARGRDVQLRGEAFFRVVHNAAQPFTVRAGNAAIRDVGTAFSVHDDGADRVRVVVSDGVVQVTSAHDSVRLGRGDVGVLEGGALAAERGAATPDDLAWTNGTLVFRDAPVSDVAADLKRWYGVEIRVSDSALLRRHFTGSFTHESPNRVLDVLALALGARVDRRGDTAYIRSSAPIK